MKERVEKAKSSAVKNETTTKQKEVWDVLERIECCMQYDTTVWVLSTI
jgi:hypothetical protein